MSEDIDIRISATDTGAARVIRQTAEGLEAMDGKVQAAARRMKVFSEGMMSIGRRASYVSGGIAAAGGALSAMANAAASSGNAIDKQAKAIGLSAEAFQEMGFAIGQVSDMSEGQFANAIRQMTTRMGQAGEGSASMVAAFAAIGVSQEDIASGAVTTEQAFGRLVETLGTAGSPAEAAAMAGKLLGEEAAKLGPILRESGGDIAALRDKARELGIVMSDDAVQASAEYADKMDELQRQTKALRDQIGTSLLPILTNQLIPAIQTKIIPGVVAFADKIGALVDWFGQLPGPVQEATGMIAGALGVGGPVILALGAMASAFSAIVAATGPIGLFIGAAVLAYTAWQKWGEDITAAVQGALATVQGAFDGALAFLGAVPERMAELGRNIIAGLKLGILEAWEDLKATFTEMFDWLPNIVKERLEIQSPSQVFARIGHEIGAGLAVGITDSAGMVTAALRGVTDDATAHTADSVGQILNSMGGLLKGSAKIGAGMALISSMIGAAKELEKGVFGFKTAALVIAKGAAFVAAIKGAGSGGGGGGSRGAATATPAAAQQPDPALIVSLNTVGDGEFIRRSDLGSVFDQLNDVARDRGYRIAVPLA